MLSSLNPHTYALLSVSLSGRLNEARGQGEVAFGLNVAGTVLGVLGWIVFIIGLSLALTVFASVEDIASSFSGAIDDGVYDMSSKTTQNCNSWR